jgi:uncharacterized membrane protein
MKIPSKKREKFLHYLFKGTVIFKGFDGILDVLSSIVLTCIPAHNRINILPFLVRKELVEDPNDLLGNYLMNISQHFLPSTIKFVILYLAIHGLVKIGMALALWSDNPKLFKIAGVVLAISIGYQMYRFTHTHSNLLLIVTIIDMLIMILLQHEYNKLVHKVVRQETR